MRTVGNDDVEHERTRRIEHFANRIAELFALHHAAALNTEALRNRNEVRIKSFRIVGRTDVLRVAEQSLSAVRAVEAVFPLGNHAEVLIVQNHGFDGELFDRHRAEFLNVHEHGTVAVNVDDGLVRMRGGHPARGSKTEAHRSRAERGNEGTRLAELEVLRRPHLVLTDTRADNRVALGFFVKRFDRFLRENVRAIAAIVLERETVLLFPTVDRFVPTGQVGLFEAGTLDEVDESDERIVQFAFDRELHLLVLVVFGAVDIEVDNRRIRREFIDGSRDAVVKARAHGDEQIGIVNRPVADDGTVHPEPVERERVFRRESAQAHERRGHGNARQVGKFAEQFRRFGGNHAAADIEHRLFRRGNEVEYELKFVIHRMQLAGNARRQVVRRKREFRHEERLLDVFRDVDDDRARASARSDFECAVNDARKVFGLEDEEAVFDDGERHPEKVRFLEGLFPDELRENLSRDKNDGNAVHERVGNGRDEVGRARSGGGKANAGFAGGTRIAARHEAAALFVAREDRANLRRTRQRLVELNRGAARISENRIDTQFFEATDNDVCPAHRRSFGNGARFDESRFIGILAHDRKCVKSGESNLLFAEAQALKTSVSEVRIPPQEAQNGVKPQRPFERLRAIPPPSPRIAGRERGRSASARGRQRRRF